MKSIPLSILAALFGLITRIRNYLYDKGWLKSVAFPQKNVVVIGNLAVGGTGKSPFVHFLLKHWPEQKQPVVLSRGYGRKTKGFLWAGKQETSDRIGDEPLTYRLQFPEVDIALGENRVKAIHRILHDLPATQSVLLDDAFQHRSLKASLQIVCTTFQQPFYLDEMLPLGRLREDISGINRADAVLVTRCPDEVSVEALESIRQKILALTEKQIPVFFSGIRYAQPQGLAAGITQWHAFAGIAHPELFFEQIAEQFDLLSTKTFPDHHSFSLAELKHFEYLANQLNDNQAIITTHKDYVRLIPLFKDFPALSSKLAYLPMEMYFIKQENEFMTWFKKELEKTQW